VFAGSGPGVHLAATLPEGMRAMSVSLSDYSSLDGLLYPGCAVDVLATFDLRGQTEDKEGGVISTTILRGVQVLAIEDKTAVSASEKTDEKAARQDRRRRVTLMVNPKQAEQLQLAMEHGMISLSMRNPSDRTMADSDERDIVNIKEFGPTPTPVATRVVEKPVYIERPAPVAPAESNKPQPWVVTVFKGSDRSEVPFQVKKK
jgi:Flp pilus assembly protein CpaB